MLTKASRSCVLKNCEEVIWYSLAAEVTLYYPMTSLVRYQVKKKGKAIPLQAWTGPEGSRRLRLPDFKTIGT